MELKIELPIYMNTSKRKLILMSMNWYRNAHYGIKDKIKKQYHDMVYYQTRGVKQAFKKQIQVKYQLWYKRADCDLMNVVSVLDKFLLDALVQAKVLSDDNVNKYISCYAEIGGKGVKNPRLVCIIEEVE